ncbi:MAG: Nramp family divalent metal transporter, partial [Flavobacteriales bacterium]
MKGGAQRKSLSEVHESVHIPALRGRWKQLAAFMGPAYLVSVGYMDPGNWATDIAGGSAFGYNLLWVLLMSNLMALLLQTLCIKLGVVRGVDLAQANRQAYPTFINIPLYVLAEIAIAACDLAEVVGMAIGLHLLFDIPVLYGVLITALDTFLILFLMQRGIRLMERIIVSIVAIIGLSFLVQMLIAQPAFIAVMGGYVPSALSGNALYLAIGIIGATVMPHNLYLHSALVQTRRIDRSSDVSIREAIRYNTIDTGIALNIAFLVNSAILILAAAAFHEHGNTGVESIEDAHLLLTGLFGTLSPILFAVALIGSGQSSTITGTLAGQIVMEGYLDLRLRPWLRRLITRLIAITPAIFCILYFGEGSLGQLLVFSQVILSLQLGFAVIPLIHFASDKKRMKGFATKGWLLVLAWISAIIIVGLNVRLVVQVVGDWIAGAGDSAWLVQLIVYPLAVMAVLLLAYVTFSPYIARRSHPVKRAPHGSATALEAPTTKIYRRICVTVDFGAMDRK